MRPVLDPATAAGGNWPELRFQELDRRIREFGHVPDVRALLPGDIMLLTRDAMVPALIRRAQGNAGYAGVDATWSHVALYTGDAMVVDANPIGGVKLRPMVQATFAHRMVVRRRADLSMEDRYRIVVKALANLRRSYSLLALPRLAWRAWCGPGVRPDGHVGGVTICSTLVGDAYAEAVQVDFRPRSIGASWPADISHTDQLCDVAIGWVKVAR